MRSEGEAGTGVYWSCAIEIAVPIGGLGAGVYCGRAAEIAVPDDGVGAGGCWEGGGAIELSLIHI